jgi:hypothetical protein
VQWRGGKYEQAYLDLRNDLFFTRVCVSTIDDADDVRLCTLHQSDRSPEHTLSATPCIAVFRVSMHRQMTDAGHDNDVLDWSRSMYNDSPVRVKETYELFLLVARIITSVV